jgi:hypothetical protein
MDNLLEAALSYSAEGYLVFPCKPRSKVPATEHGFYDATKDEETIRGWWEENPRYNVAIRTGTESNLVVLDVDEGGRDTLEDLFYGWGTTIVKTCDGYHSYFQHPGGNVRCKTAFLEGLDLKADGGYVLAPPSLHPDGPQYEWVAGSFDKPLEECPSWLVTPDDVNAISTGVTMADVETEEVTWLWERRIPYGKITLLEGDPDNGKSLISMDLAARVSRSALDILGTLGTVGTLDGVVILNAEDGLGDTVRPRLEAAGADPTKIRAVHPIKTDNALFRIPDDIALLEKEIEYVGAGLVIIDPLSAFMKGDPYKDNEVRKALTPLADMANRTGVAVMVIRHFNKNEDTKALYRGGGSIGIIGAARSALAVAPHPTDDDVYVLVAQKGNLSRKADTLSYTIVEAPNGAPRIQWGGVVNLTADEALTANVNVSEEAKTRVWLENYLANGPKPSNDVKAAADADGIAERTLTRAKKGVARSYKDGDVWMMVLVNQESQQGQEGQESQERQDGTVEGDDTPDSSVTHLPDRLMAVS